MMRGRNALEILSPTSTYFVISPLKNWTLLLSPSRNYEINHGDCWFTSFNEDYDDVHSDKIAVTNEESPITEVMALMVVVVIATRDKEFDILARVEISD